MKETAEHNNRFYTNEKGEIKTENEQLKEWLLIANKENERLKEEYMILQNASDKVEEELQQRINKAIEYITTEQLYTNYQWGEEFYSQLLKDLLNILKGSDENE